MADGRRHQIQRGLYPLTRLFFSRRRIARKQQLQPCGPPMQLPHDHLHMDIRQGRHFDHGCPTKRATQVNGIADGTVTLLQFTVHRLPANHHTTPLGKRALGSLRQMSQRLGTLRPTCYGTKRASSRRTKEHEPRSHPFDHATLQGQPSLAKGSRCRGSGERNPWPGVLQYRFLSRSLFALRRTMLQMGLMHLQLSISSLGADWDTMSTIPRQRIIHRTGPQYHPSRPTLSSKSIDLGGELTTAGRGRASSHG